MSYTLHGRLRGWLCDDCHEPLSNVTVRVYRATEKLRVAEGGDERPHLFSAEEAEERRVRLLGEGRADEQGSFRVDFGENARYEGGPVEVDVRVERVPRLRGDPPREPVQFTAAVADPAWERGQAGMAARLDVSVAFRIWCWIRSLFDAWTVCGHLVTCKEGLPIAGATVRAYDADWLQDDGLGTALTDAGGHFRIDYTGAQFRRTPFSPLINAELTEGPDLYFRAWHDGNLVLEETQGDGRARGRENVGHCHCVRLCTDKVRVLVCQLTGPNGCVHGTLGLLPDRVLQEITGTAHGAGFSRYEIEVLWDGTVPVPGAVVYPDAGGNPDPSLPEGTHPVSAGTLGWMDLHKLATAPGADIAASTNFTVRMRVFGEGGQVHVCVLAVTISASAVYVRTVGGAVAEDVLPQGEPLMRGGPSQQATVGGSVTVRGAAAVHGCAGEEIAQYHLWVRADPSFSIPQPSNGTPFASAGWTSVTSADFTTPVTIGAQTFTPAQLRAHNDLTGSPDDALLTRGGWTTRTQWVIFDSLGPIPVKVPHLAGGAWATHGGGFGTGKYSVLLQVIDTAGNTYYDVQRVWVDNEPIQVALTGLGGLPACTDLFTKEPGGAFRTIGVDGTAWDALIDPGDPAKPTSDNFSHYVVQFQKQGAAGWVTLPAAVPDASPASSPQPDASAWLTGSVPVPARPDPAGIGTLATWDLQSIDAASNPFSLPADQLLGPGEACTYLVRLIASDFTLVSESTTHWDQDFFPVKVINAEP